MRKHAAGRGFAIGAGNAGDWDFAWAALWEQHFHHRAADVAALPFAWGNVHTKARCGVDLANPAAVRAITLADVFAQEIHPAHIQANRFSGTYSHRLGVGVHDVGYIDGGAAGGKVSCFA